MRGIEMLNQHERHAAVGRHRPEEAGEGIEPARRGAHPHDRQTACRWRPPAARSAGLRRPTSRGPFRRVVRVRFACRTIGSLANPTRRASSRPPRGASPNGVCWMRRDRPGRRRLQPADHSALRVQGWPPRSSRATAPSGMGRALRRLDPRQQRARSLRSPDSSDRLGGAEPPRPAPSGRPRAGAAPLRKPIWGISAMARLIERGPGGAQALAISERRPRGRRSTLADPNMTG